MASNGCGGVRSYVFLFGSLPREERKSKWRRVCSFISHHELLARPVDAAEGTYEVNIQSSKLCEKP